MSHVARGITGYGGYRQMISTRWQSVAVLDFNVKPEQTEHRCNGRVTRVTITSLAFLNLIGHRGQSKGHCPVSRLLIKVVWLSPVVLRDISHLTIDVQDSARLHSGFSIISPTRPSPGLQVQA